MQVFDLPTLAVTVTEYLMMRRTCCDCGHATTAAPPAQATGGPACYGPNVVAAATFLASQDVIGIERAAGMMSALLGADVSTGFVSRCLARLDQALREAGFEDTLKAALCAADVLGTDETPPRPGHRVRRCRAERPHWGRDQQPARVHRADDALVHHWRPRPGVVRRSGHTHQEGDHRVRDPGQLHGGPGPRRFRRLPVLRPEPGRAWPGSKQCVAHLLRHLQDARDIDPGTQVWAVQAADVLRAAIHAVNQARRTGTDLDPDVITAARKSYDTAVACGISINLSRPWPQGNHPGLILAKRLHRKSDQVWLFTTRGDVPPTNNGSEAAIRGFKLAEKVSGCWRTLATLQRHCHLRSYLDSARNHGRRPLDAIRDALTGTPWTPPPRTAVALTA